MRPSCLLVLASLLTACAGSSAASAPAGAEAEPVGEACSAPVYREFDFWLGRWVVHDPEGALAGRNHIERAHQGCALLEHWRSASGNTGTSINYYDGVEQQWVQNWIDAQGAVIQLEGGLREGAMILEGRYAQADGSSALMRGTWTPLEGGRVRQRFEVSTDGGVSWTLWFEGVYARE